ncbi:hypothetical protein WJX73_010280 [Symbiochloris irregularis]|uniref:Uncharacterized protein n=1 Tax=Symbiochloris irregularis TaxID=706552 RepID=A0AAW1NR86_9CHLO
MKGTDAAALQQLWSCDTVKDWGASLETYTERVANFKPDLGELDRHLFAELSVELEQADQPCLKGEELAKLVDWKLKRGKWRPRLLDFVKSNHEDAVKATSGDAFALVRIQSQHTVTQQQVVKAIAALSKLKGVGPATASAAISLYNKRLPFMSDEAIAVTTSAKPRYTVEEYLDVVKALQQKADKLSQEGDEWSARDVERALWSAAHASLPEAESSKPSVKAATKRKRG